MRYFHYSTWHGDLVEKSRVVQPSAIYGAGSKEEGWMPLVFLTQDDNWESSLQAVAESRQYPYAKGTSSPGQYTAQDIPCWKFEVDVKDSRNIMYSNPSWLKMFEDAVMLGSDISKWHWTEKEVVVVKAYQYLLGEWSCVAP